jgi:GTPase SAR1 family protein
LEIRLLKFNIFHALVAGISTRTKYELTTALLEGSYSSHENRVYLVGPSKSGKTSLACILIGNDIPKTWNSTNGLSIYYGQNGINLITKKMYPLSGKCHTINIK